MLKKVVLHLKLSFTGMSFPLLSIGVCVGVGGGGYVKGQCEAVCGRVV